MNELTARSKRLLEKAREDAYVASSLADDPAVSYWIIGFHAQQAVEKAIKSVLVLHEIRYPFTHDLASLLKSVDNSGLPLPPEFESLPYLTPFGTLFRYEDEHWGTPVALEVHRVLNWVGTTITWAENTVLKGL